MSIAQPRLLFIGICSGDPGLIREGAAAGRLPNLRALLQDSLVGATEGLPGVFVGAHWPSFISGCHPGHNGVHSWEQLRPGSYESYRCAAALCARRPPFWDALSAAGRRLCILDVPHSGVSPGINGLQTVEWGAHDAALGFQTSTPALRREILRRFGRHPVSGNSDADRTPEELCAFRDKLVEGAQRKAELTRHFLGQGPWDLFAQVFTETHCAGHLLWHTHDVGHPRHAEVVGCGDLLLDVYAAVDTAIGQVLDGVGPQTTVVLLASHGMGPRYGAQHLLAALLLGLGVAAPMPLAHRPPTLRERTDPWLSRGWHLLPASWRALLQPLRRNAVAWVTADRRPPQLIDPAASLCFPVQNNSATGALRVNLAGREPDGRVQPGRDYEALLDRLTADFLALRNEATGDPVVAAVYRTDELYPGDAREHLPDLMIQWANTAPVDAIVSPAVGRVAGRYAYCRTGDHHPRGLYAARAPWLGAGTGPTMSCVDFAPTLGELLGVPLPGLDGRINPALLPATATAAAR